MLNLLALVYGMGMTLWAAVAILLYHRIRQINLPPLKPKDCLLPEPRRTPLVFPAYCARAYPWAILAFILLMSGLMILIIWGTVCLQRVLFDTPDVWVFDSPNIIVLAGLPALFLGIALTGMVLKQGFLWFPLLNEYQALRNFLRTRKQGIQPEQWQEALLTMDVRKVALADDQTTLKMVLWIWILTVPVLLLSLNDYTQIKSNGMTMSHFWAYPAVTYPWSKLNQVHIYFNLAYSRGQGYHLVPHYVVETADGQQQELWGSFGPFNLGTAQLVQISDRLHRLHVPFQMDPITSETLHYLNQLDPGKQREVRALIAQIQSYQPIENQTSANE